MKAARHTPAWWALVCVHNIVVHPWLPLADLLDLSGVSTLRWLAKQVYAAHDATYPEGGG